MPLVLGLFWALLSLFILVFVNTNMLLQFEMILGGGSLQRKNEKKIEVVANL
jgi:hypothetical protein